MAQAQRFAVGGAAEAGATQEKKIRKDEKIGLTVKPGRVSAKYLDNANASGEVVADRLQELGSAPLFSVQSSSATSGYGPKLYDAVMEGVTESGNQLVSDRHSVSSSAYNVWKYYFKNRGDVNKTPLAPENWYHGSKWFDQTKFPSEDPKTWPPHSDEAWVLQTGYTKSPSDIKNPNLVERFAMGGVAEAGATQEKRHYIGDGKYLAEDQVRWLNRLEKDRDSNIEERNKVSDRFHDRLNKADQKEIEEKLKGKLKSKPGTENPYLWG